MNPRLLGTRSGLEVSEVGLGLWAVSGSEWGPVQDEENLEAIDTALESGVTFFDTADVYRGGHSEELLGRAMQTRREAFVVATKIGWIDFDGQANRSQYDSVDRLVAGVEGSLRRLGTDRIDGHPRMSSSCATWTPWSSCATWSPTARPWPSSLSGSSAATQQ